MHLLAALALTAASFVHVSGDLISYDPRVPEGARATVTSIPFGGSTIVALKTTGLLPNREYGAHAHVNACGPKPADAGPHYQNVQGGATDPKFANPQNEIWLDFTTDDKGRGISYTKVKWQFKERHANAVVIHEEHTHTGEGHAGTAGARIGCLTVRF
ncbi:hypothetical protein GCM10022243_51130 [Saccharothrix violaceirubra]|uniref:Cu-Zn family superoxide dismutase n=1 Tax=Saccharothrix violaceirubra TaxID=413306 RepID=A0A7W7WT36_9PSEU|nr:superoxide dismutase family protein [Saccharothrix violaceirubra]MBB4962674.1 Cu-Zn family superoxide dismutase [Saccharothrix violaceirubra]